MKLIAIREDESYLIDLENNNLGFVYDSIENVRWPEKNIDSILARGGWTGSADNDLIVKRAMKAKELESLTEEEKLMRKNKGL